MDSDENTLRMLRKILSRFCGEFSQDSGKNPLWFLRRNLSGFREESSFFREESSLDSDENLFSGNLQNFIYKMILYSCKVHIHGKSTILFNYTVLDSLMSRTYFMNPSRRHQVVDGDKTVHKKKYVCCVLEMCETYLPDPSFPSVPLPYRCQSAHDRQTVCLASKLTYIRLLLYHRRAKTVHQLVSSSWSLLK